MILSIEDLPLHHQTVLIRVDFNVPLDAHREITDDFRIRAALPTIQKVMSEGGKAVLISHLGRPKGKRIPELSLAPVATHLSKLLRHHVNFIPDCIGETVRTAIDRVDFGEVVLLENVRFYPGEEANDPQFADALASLGTVYLNDAFGTAHRAHASTVGVPQRMQYKGAGYLLAKEIHYLQQVIENPASPFVAILGGAKISGKIELIERFLHQCNQILIGGGMAFTFLKALGKEVGKSLVEADKIELAQSLLQQAENAPSQLLLPVDIVVASQLDPAATTQIVSRDHIPPDMMGVDIGPRTTEVFTSAILSAKTVVWNGPMGVFELEPFSAGTRAIAEALAKATENGATTIVGGGDSAAAIRKFGLDTAVSHVSTGGGASLALLAGKPLPALQALEIEPKNSSS